MEKLLRGLNKNHINTKNNSVKPAGFIFKNSCFSVSRQADRTICEAINHFRDNVAKYDYFASFKQADLASVPYQASYQDTPSHNNPYHGTVSVRVSNDEIVAKQQLIVIKQELTEISSLISYENDCPETNDLQMNV